MPILIPILGPTGVGKTKVSLLLAEIFNTEIVSCDARQFYRELNIGTSSPESEMLGNIQHHLIGHLTIWNSYSAGDYQKDAFKKLNELFTRIPIILMVGGSGLYGRAIIYGINSLQFFSKEVSRDLYINIIYQDFLKKKYHVYFERNNFLKLLRGTINNSFQILKIGLILHKNDLFKKINQRVEYMIKCGFLEEAQESYSYRFLKALHTIGYIDLFNYFDGKIGFDKNIEEIKKNTRRYAKRQITWVKKEIKLQWFFSYKENEILKNFKKKIFYIKDKMF